MRAQVDNPAPLPPAAPDVAPLPTLEVLQRFVLPASPERQPLHLRLTRGELVFEDQRLRSTPFASLCFDTHLNSFYEAYWVAQTSVERLELLLEGQGRVRCTIHRDARGSGLEVVARELLDLGAGGVATIPLQLRRGSRGDPGRLFATLEADDAGLALDRIAWATPDPPLRSVSLGVGICTLDRERFLARTLERLLRASPDACIDEVLVVNQGEPIRSGWLEDLRAHEPARLRVLEKADGFEGAGGLAGAALELLKRPSTSHVLFMDDDVEVEPSQLPTAVAFLRYSRARLVLGAQMLDLLNRRSTPGAEPESADRRASSEPRLDLRARETLQNLAQVALSHFNGWWFAAVPAEAFRTYGLPLPIFIRGDDMEFGIRLRQAGIPTVSLPPTSTADAPFYATPAGLKHYYDLRNRLIFASLHPEHAHLESPTRLAKVVLAMLVRYDYQHVAIIREALADFLRGPELLDALPDAIHAGVLERLGPHAPQAIMAVADELATATSLPSSRRAGRRRVLLSLISGMAGAPPRNPAGADCLMDGRAPLHRMRLGRSYVVAEPGEPHHLRYSYSWRRGWTALAGVLPVIMRYRRHRLETAARWRAASAMTPDAGPVRWSAGGSPC